MSTTDKLSAYIVEKKLDDEWTPIRMAAMSDFPNAVYKSTLAPYERITRYAPAQPASQSTPAGEVTADAVEVAWATLPEVGKFSDGSWKIITKPDMQAALAAAFPALVQQVERLTDEVEDLEKEVTKVIAERDTLSAENAHKQARIDSLMLEYCPDEMTSEQVENWAAHQVRCSPEDEAAINAALGKDAATAQAKQGEG